MIANIFSSGGARRGNARWLMLVAGALLVAITAEAQVSPAVSALWSQVTLYRDEWGTPHIYADNTRAMAFAFGYAQAEDHLEAMLMAYRFADGRVAEVKGEAYAKADQFAIALNHAGLAAAAYPVTDSITHDLCEGFAFGVNTWLVEHPKRVPPWADGVRPQDVLALLHCYLMSFAPFDLPGAYRIPPAAWSGNAFAVAPSHSRSGKTILALNAQTAYNGPFQWYEAHLVCGDYNVAGATLYGLPIILQGHNEVMGWALTPNHPDTADIYIETLPKIQRNPKIPTVAGQVSLERELLYGALAASTRTYYVKMPYGMVKRKARRLDMAHGPVVGEYHGHLCSWKIAGYRDFGGITQLFQMGRAQNLAQFQAALRMQQLPCFHILYADRSGNLFYVYNAKVANRRTSAAARTIKSGKSTGPLKPFVPNWTRPLPGDDPRYDWGDFVPPNLLPSVLNPASGYLQICGNPPWGVTTGTALKPGEWPAWFAHDPDTLRARRVRLLLGMGPRSFLDMQNMLYDILIPGAVETVPLLLKAAAQAPEFVANAHPDLGVELDLLRNWDYVAETNSSAMTFFRVWWAELHRAAGPAMAEDSALVDMLEKDTPQTRRLALNAANDAVMLLRNQFQTATVPWGEVHTLRRGNREAPLYGCAAGEPVFTVSDNVFRGDKWPVTYGPAFAMVVRFGEQPEAVSMTPFGASDSPDSPHYDDQMKLLLERRFKRTRFQRDDIMRNCESARGRVVRLRPLGMEALFTITGPSPIEARLNVSTTPPAKLPEGLSAFTVYVTPQIAPAEAPVTVNMGIYIAGVLCDAQHLDQLAVYAYDTEHGWVRLANQQLDPSSRTFRAQDTKVRTVAVLGSSNLRPNQKLTIPGAPKPASGPRLAKAESTQLPLWLQREAAPFIPRENLPRTSPQLARKLLGINEPVSEPPLRPSTLNEEHRPPVPFEYNPDEAQSNRVTRNYNLNLRPPAKQEAPKERRRRHKKRKQRGQRDKTRLAQEQSAPPHPISGSPVGPRSALLPFVPQSGSETPPSPTSPNFLKQHVESAPPVEPRRSPLATSLAPAARGPRYPSTGGWGREVQLQPPGMQGLVVIRFPMIAKAVLFVAKTPPAPLPNGMTAFTKFIGLRVSPPHISADIAINITVPEKACSAEGFHRLSLYAYDNKKGWYSLKGQKTDPGLRTFTGIDVAPHVYVILGPTKHKS